MQLTDERVDLLLACFRRDQQAQDLMELRAAVLAGDEAFQGLMLAADRRMLGAALVDALGARGILHPAGEPFKGPLTPRRQITDLTHRHSARHKAQGEALSDIIRALNAENIHPLLFKGAAALFVNSPAWRSQRDLDFAVQPDEVTATRTALESLGYRVQKQMSPRHHHIDTMVRPDPDIAVEAHVRLNGRRSSRILGDLFSQDCDQPVEIGDLKARMLRPDFALLHGLIHHHFENRGNNFGVISLKGLLEFSHGFQNLDEGDVANLAVTGWQVPRVGAACELWITACRNWLGVPVPEALTPSRAAETRLARITGRLLTDQPASMLAACREELVHLLRSAPPQGKRLAGRIASIPPILFNSIEDRPWGGRLRELKSAGLLAFAEPPSEQES